MNIYIHTNTDSSNTYTVYSNIYIYLGGCIRLGLYPNQNSETKSKRYLNATGVRKAGHDCDPIMTGNTNTLSLDIYIFNI